MMSLTLDSLPQSTDYLCPSLHSPWTAVWEETDISLDSLSLLTKSRMPNPHVYLGQESKLPGQNKCQMSNAAQLTAVCVM